MPGVRQEMSTEGWRARWATLTSDASTAIPPEAGSRGHTSILRAIGHAVKKYTPSASPPRGRPKQRTVLVVRRDHLDDRDLAARSNMLSVEVGTAIMRARVELGRCWSTAFHALCLPMQSSSEGRSTMKDVIVALSRTNGSCDRFRASGRISCGRKSQSVCSSSFEGCKCARWCCPAPPLL